MDTNGTLYLYRSSLLCVNEIIKRLSEGKYQLAEPSMLGKTGNTYNQLKTCNYIMCENENLQFEAPAKRSQHANAIHRNIVGCNMLRAFGQTVATC